MDEHTYAVLHNQKNQTGMGEKIGIKAVKMHQKQQFSQDFPRGNKITLVKKYDIC